jgi:hypothetical protein
MNINLDTFDWGRNKHVCIINGVITDRRMVGNSIKTSHYNTARKIRDSGWENCPICGDLCPKKLLRTNHLISKAHLDFLKGREKQFNTRGMIYKQKLEQVAERA